jgi:glycine/D-amino acid oxidase-like deaminating enzyme
VAGGETIDCETVVVAAGAWSRNLVAPLGVDLPVEITREQDVVYASTGTAPALAVSSQVDRIYLRPLESDGRRRIIVGRGYPKEYEVVDPDDYNATFDSDFERDVSARLAKRFKALGILQAEETRVGLYTVTPDWHPILGRVHDIEGLVLATGGSGHCFKLGPAIGEMVAGNLLDRDVSYADIDAFSLERFARGDTFGSSFGGNRA